MNILKNILIKLGLIKPKHRVFFGKTLIFEYCFTVADDIEGDFVTNYYTKEGKVRKRILKQERLGSKEYPCVYKTIEMKPITRTAFIVVEYKPGMGKGRVYLVRLFKNYKHRRSTIRLSYLG